MRVEPWIAAFLLSVEAATAQETHEFVVCFTGPLCEAPPCRQNAALNLTTRELVAELELDRSEAVPPMTSEASTRLDFGEMVVEGVVELREFPGVADTDIPVFVVTRSDVRASSAEERQLCLGTPR
jgi:hypothetical protein